MAKTRDTRLDAAAFRRLTEQATESRSTWGAAAVRSAIAAHEQGEFDGSGALAQRMTRDPRIKGALEMRIGHLLTCPFVMEPASDDARSIDIAKQLASTWNADVPEHELSAIMRSWILMGFAIGKIDWYHDGMTLRSCLRALDPQFARRDQATGAWTYVAAEGEQRVAGPGWFLFTQGSHGYLDGTVRTLGVPWLMRDVAWESWSRLNERHGIPFMKVYVPASADAADKDAIANEARIVTEEGAAMLPQNVDGAGTGYDIQFAEIQAQAWMTHQQLLKELNDEIAISILKQNLTTEVNAGSFAAATVHMQVLDSVIASDSEALSQALREQIVMPRAMLCFADAARHVPTPVYDATDSGNDNTLFASDLKTLSDALKGMRDLGIGIENLDSVMRRFGIVPKLS